MVVRVLSIEISQVNLDINLALSFLSNGYEKQSSFNY
jgi:hypothetical protein